MPWSVRGKCLVAMQGRRDRHWERCIYLDVFEAKPTKAQRERVLDVPPFWPKQSDFVRSRLAWDVVKASKPSESERSAGKLPVTKLRRSGVLAGHLAEHLGIESFILVTDAEGVPQSIHGIGMQPGDHDGARHVLTKAGRLFLDYPEEEHHFLFDDVRKGMLLTEREREGIVEGVPFEGLTDPESHYALTGKIRAYDERPTPRPYTPLPPRDSHPMEKAGDDPGLSDALERLRLAVLQASPA